MYLMNSLSPAGTGKIYREESHTCLLAVIPKNCHSKFKKFVFCGLSLDDRSPLLFMAISISKISPTPPFQSFITGTASDRVN